MAFTTILRRVASSAAVRSAVRSQQRSYSSSTVFSPVRRCTLSHQRTFVPAHHFSALAKKQDSDTLLLKVIEAEIECAKETDDHDRVEPTPAGFPFKIIDKPGEQTVTLEREYQGEVIKVQVHMPDLVTGNEGEEDNKDSGDDNEGESSAQSSIPLVVSVTKQNGPCLEFSVMAYADEISIDSLSVKQPDASEEQIAYEGPDFGDLDENLQKAFHKYLEIRGIKPSTTNFLHEYMINKDSREYLIWLKNLKNFVEN